MLIDLAPRTPSVGHSQGNPLATIADQHVDNYRAAISLASWTYRRGLSQGNHLTVEYIAIHSLSDVSYSSVLTAGE